MDYQMAPGPFNMALLIAISQDKNDNGVGFWTCRILNLEEGEHDVEPVEGGEHDVEPVESWDGEKGDCVEEKITPDQFPEGGAPSTKIFGNSSKINIETLRNWWV